MPPLPNIESGWTVDLKDFGIMDNRTAYVAVDDGQHEVARVACDRKGWEDRARLISAAPELLEALQWFIANDETNEGDDPLPEKGGATWNEINAYWIEGLNKGRAAVAKALGGQQ